MLFTETPRLRALERLMTSIPNVMPRASGVLVIHRFEPPPEVGAIWVNLSDFDETDIIVGGSVRQRISPSR